MNKHDQIQALREQLENDYKKLPLVQTKEELVPGFGNADTEILFIGEAAGRNELLQRKPFVGQAGKLLNKALESIGIKREDVYISNVVKARPPENRDPTPEEIAAYRPYLDKEIEIIDPRLIITLGRFSMGKFIPDVKISMVHGRLHKVTWKGTTRFVLPMYHPAAALRRGIVLEAFMKDFSKVPKILEYAKKKENELLEIASIQDALF